MVIILQLALDVSPLQWEWEAAKMIVGPQSLHSRISPMPGYQHNRKQRFTNHFFPQTFFTKRACVPVDLFQVLF